MGLNYNKKELDLLMKGMVIKIDNREKNCSHIVSYFTERNIEYEFCTMETADYGAYIKANPELGIFRNIHIDAVVERKAHIEEICGNLQKSTQTAFINELRRGKDIPFTIIVEDKMTYEKLINGNYRSKYDPKALLGRINSLKAEFGFELVYIDSRLSGNWIYYHLYYQAREYLKNL